MKQIKSLEIRNNLDFFDEKMFVNTLDPNKVIELNISNIDTDEVDIFSLGVFKNLRSLQLFSMKFSVDYI